MGRSRLKFHIVWYLNVTTGVVPKCDNNNKINNNNQITTLRCVISKIIIPLRSIIIFRDKILRTFRLKRRQA